MHYEKPCTKEMFSEPYLIKDCRKHIFIDGLEMTAENIWNRVDDREALVEKLVDYFYINEAPLSILEPEDVIKRIKKLIKKDPAEAFDEKNNWLKNTSTTCLDVCRSFNAKEFRDVKVNGTASINEVFKSKDILRKILKNRLGWFTTTEKLPDDSASIQKERPYLFDISWQMVIQGAHSSMASANVSNFRPLIAKWLLDRYCKLGKSVLDLSAGWGARYLAALSLKKEYYGIDPMTASNIQKLHELCLEKLEDYTSKKTRLVKAGSELESSFKDFPEDIDYCFVCPPYFKLEEYKCEGNSTDLFEEYDSWLERYWKPTVENATKKLKYGAKFSLIMVEKWMKHDLAKDMTKVILEAGFKEFETVSYKTTRSHLTDKRKSGKMEKDTEKVWTFEKI